MTNREFFTAIVNGEMNEDIQAKAAEEIVKLDATNAQRAAKAAEKRAEKDAEKAPIREALLAVIDNEPKTATSLIEAAGLDIKPQSVPSLLKPFVENGTVVKTDIKVVGKASVRGYVLA